MVLAYANVFTRMMNCASLTNQNVTGFGNFATEKLNT